MSFFEIILLAIAIACAMPLVPLIMAAIWVVVAIIAVPFIWAFEAIKDMK